MKKYLLVAFFAIVSCVGMNADSQAVWRVTDGGISYARLNDSTSVVTTSISGGVNIQDDGSGGNYAGGVVHIIDNLGNSVCTTGISGKSFYCEVNGIVNGAVKIAAGYTLNYNVPPSGGQVQIPFGEMGSLVGVQDLTPPTSELVSVEPASIDVTQGNEGFSVDLKVVDYGSGGVLHSAYVVSPSAEHKSYATNWSKDTAGVWKIDFEVPEGVELGEWKVGIIIRNGGGLSVTDSNFATFQVIDGSGPQRMNLSPSQDVELNDTDGEVELALTTNEIAECRYSITSGEDFDKMTVFEKTNTKEHSVKIKIEIEKKYKYYVKCKDEGGNLNGADEIISFKTTKDYENKDEGIQIEKPELTLKGKLKNLKLSKRSKLYSDKKEMKFGGQVDSELIGGKVVIKGRKGSKKIKDETEIDVDGNWKEKVKFDKNGTWKVKFEFYDKYGDKVDTIGSYKILIDNDDPAFVDLKDQYTVSAGETITLTAYDNHKLKEFKIYFKGKKHKIKPAHHRKKSSTIVAFVVPVETPTGTYDMEIRVYDKSNNKTVRHVQVRVQ